MLAMSLFIRYCDPWTGVSFELLAEIHCYLLIKLVVRVVSGISGSVLGRGVT